MVDPTSHPDNSESPAATDKAARDPLAILPGYTLRRAANAMMAELGALLGEVELRVSEASILLLIDGRSTMTSSLIGAALDIRSANMAPLISSLVARGLVERVPLDGKSMAIVLTEPGRAVLARVRTITQDFEQTLMLRIPPEHRDHFVPALNALWR
ncbi:MarR family winged helix-turn-helix transcriptional regulator [Novosphingobium sp. 1949]|uniref:MarR family winged helix-turn-helix transcriptional regulator n=1 Tax=Novosphingobium organovorum TaxID=2930092 RepID=A0ABT0BHY1_9SPHN|nr:MarR family winged helix-turn-helix transcriptional regulator [Novosphingobium organovorum]MCJ2184652.1 MarR family winged helix-turn-helix transcriptional regulator [Novosphingobium organovorum]